jgi:hypothetical protein
MKFIKVFLLILLLKTTLMAAMAFQATRVFTQPDGTKFQGVLKGDSALNWIESDGKVVVYNPQDKYYYEAIIDEEKGLVPSDKKVEAVDDSISFSSLYDNQIKSLPIEQKEQLKNLIKKRKQGNYPR